VWTALAVKERLRHLVVDLADLVETVDGLAEFSPCERLQIFFSASESLA